MSEQTTPDTDPATEAEADAGRAASAPAAVAITMRMTAADAEHLMWMSADWADYDDETRRLAAEGFETLDGPLPEHGAAPRASWRRAHWVGECYASLLLLRSYLDAHGYDYETFWDTTPTGATGDPGSFRGYVILTDWND